MIALARRFWLAALLMAAATPASAETAWPTGLYSNVRMSRQTGDYGGMEARSLAKDFSP